MAFRNAVNGSFGIDGRFATIRGNIHAHPPRDSQTDDEGRGGWMIYGIREAHAPRHACACKRTVSERRRMLSHPIIITGPERRSFLKGTPSSLARSSLFARRSSPLSRAATYPPAYQREWHSTANTISFASEQSSRTTYHEGI